MMKLFTASMVCWCCLPPFSNQVRARSRLVPIGIDPELTWQVEDGHFSIDTAVFVREKKKCSLDGELCIRVGGSFQLIDVSGRLVEYFHGVNARVNSPLFKEPEAHICTCTQRLKPRCKTINDKKH
jgi:hypothetical protein